MKVHYVECGVGMLTFSENKVVRTQLVPRNSTHEDCIIAYDEDGNVVNIEFLYFNHLVNAMMDARETPHTKFKV